MHLSLRAVSCWLSLFDRNNEPCFISFDTLIFGILDLVYLLGRIHKTSLHVLKSYPNIFLYNRLILLDHIILPFFLLGTFFRKVSFLITNELLSCEMSFYSWRECSSFLFFLCSAWVVRVWLSSLLLLKSINLLLTCIPPYAILLLEQLSWMNLEYHSKF